VLLVTVIIGISFAAFMLGWLSGYKKACRVHGWYLPQFNWRKDAAMPKNAMLRSFSRSVGN
jgi:hypothetical protein